MTSSSENKTNISNDITPTPDNVPVFEKVFQLISEAYQPTEFRSNVKLWGAGILALILWILLVSLAWTHFQSSRKFAVELSTLKEPSEEKISLIEKSADMVDSTADRLYTFLTPIVTAITGYFFVASSSRPRESKPEQERKSQ